MKRRRGNKKGRPKKQKPNDTNEVASHVLSINTEENSGMDEHDNEDVESAMDVKAETSAKTQSPSGLTQRDAIVSVDQVPRPADKLFGQAVYTRVRVKIKTSKNTENQKNLSNPPAQSDTDKRSQHVYSEKQGGLNEKMEDSANSISEANGVSSGNITKKSLGIKIKSSRGLVSSGLSPCSNTEPVKGDKTETKDVDLPHEESRWNEQELKAALEVIRKVMKMDAAEPFNAPVNPVALGIPDYFDVIDTPMDFGTICSNLEKGVKYKNSKDVYKDVQYVWDNCFKYNNKGDYIVELVKRVRKAFTKYWTALGLFSSDQPMETDSGESNPQKDLTPSNEGNTPGNGAILNLSGKKFHGLRKHKEGCQCAICVMMRRRQEREEIARLMGGHSEVSDDSLNEDVKKEGVSLGESPFGEYTSSNMENSPGADTDVERKGQETTLGHIKNFYDLHNNGDNSFAVSGQDRRSIDGNGLLIGLGTEPETSKRNEDLSNQQKPKEVLDKNQRAKMLENLRYLENPMLLDLYSTLFSENSVSFWNGPHSLVGGHRRRSSSLHSAISSFVKK